MTTYSFKDTSGVISGPTIVTPFSLFGQIGLGQFIVAMTTDHTVFDTAADGTIMGSAIPGDSGQLSIEMQQTSNLYDFLWQTYNGLKTAMLLGNVTNWLGMSITIRNIVDGSSHNLTGVGFGKPPDKVYAAQGQRITWVLPAADIQTVTP
jgi:hypothetical protein